MQKEFIKNLELSPYARFDWCRVPEWGRERGDQHAKSYKIAWSYCDIIKKEAMQVLWEWWKTFITESSHFFARRRW